jgi:hypothetical protein
MRGVSRVLFLGAVGGTLLFGGVGCVEVMAYERGRLTEPCMLPSPNPMSAAFTEHVYEYREGSAGGTGIVGGGCGCN